MTHQADFAQNTQFVAQLFVKAAHLTFMVTHKRIQHISQVFQRKLGSRPPSIAPRFRKQISRGAYFDLIELLFIEAFEVCGVV